MINFNTLVTIDEQLNYVPKLAESWEMQDNGKVYMFRLRKGVKFHDGNDFDADAGGMQPAELGGPALHNCTSWCRSPPRHCLSGRAGLCAGVCIRARPEDRL